MRKMIIIALLMGVLLFLSLPVFSGGAVIPQNFSSVEELVSEVTRFLSEVIDFWLEKLRLVISAIVNFWKEKLGVGGFPDSLSETMALFTLLGTVSLCIKALLFVSSQRTQQKIKKRIEWLSNEFDQVKEVVVSRISTGAERGFFPPENICGDFVWWSQFNLQKAANIITDYYGVPRARIVTDERRVQARRRDDNWVGLYVSNSAEVYLTKRGMTATVLLHELLHHLHRFGKAPVDPSREEVAADKFAAEICRRAKQTLEREYARAASGYFPKRPSPPKRPNRRKLSRPSSRRKRQSRSKSFRNSWRAHTHLLYWLEVFSCISEAAGIPVGGVHHLHLSEGAKRDRVVCGGAHHRMLNGGVVYEW